VLAPYDLVHQLEAVAALQRRLLPRQIPQPPGWRLAVHYNVGARPGGDYYDFLLLPDGRLLLLIADASDEGGPSAVLVAIVRVVLHACPLSSGAESLPFCPLRGEVVQPPHLILGHLNRVLAENSLEGQFMTAFCGLLSPAEGTLRYANAGHVPPRLWRAATGTVEPLNDASGLPLAMETHSAYHHKKTCLEPGDVLVLYSDGLTACQDRRGSVFGTSRLDDVIRRLAPGGAEKVKTGLLASVESFLGREQACDDLTLVILERQA
jgi:sigma-B regulation protein RsbU (phosphoserine phosphatase)